MKVREIGEFGLINRLVGQLPPLSDNVIKGIGDDTAVLRNEGGNSLLMTTDMLVENIHFSLKYGSYRSVGWKALAVNVSDIAAMGGKPTYATAAIAIPSEAGVSQMEELYSGIAECAREYGVDVVGGDTVRSTGGLAINITLLGTVESGKAVCRSGALPGDIIMVTGTLGKSAAGLFVLNNSITGISDEMVREVTDSHLFPIARLREGKALGQSGFVTSMNDISDGLASEVLEICSVSGTGCELFADKIPCSRATAEVAMKAGIDSVGWALYGGEDFELVFTVKSQNVNIIAEKLKQKGCSTVIVGKIVPVEQGCYLISKDSKTVLRPDGYNHFRD